MGKLKILTKDRSPESLGKLVQNIMTQVLRSHGYRILRNLNVDYTAMEIEAEGKHSATGAPLYAECNYSETAVTAREFQAFFGKHMTRWHKDRRCHGLLIALSGVDNDAGKFYREHIENNPEVTARLCEENDVLEAVSDAPGAARPDTIAGSISRQTGRLGKRFLMVTEKGLFWVQYVIPHGTGAPPCVAVFDAQGNPVSDRPALDYLTRLYPDLADCENIAVRSPAALQPSLFQDAEDIVELQASPECFAYQLPASPEHFVGRQPYFEKLDSIALNVINKKTSCRGILLEAASGWGKSSLLLAWVARLIARGHIATAIDSRSLLSSWSIPHVLNYVIRRWGDFGGRLPFAGDVKPFSSVEGSVRAMLEIGQSLQRHGILMLIFFDQFEHVFFQQKLLERFRDLFRYVSDAQVNVVLGFSYTTGLMDPGDGVSYELWETITNSSRHIALDLFTAVETNELLDKLSRRLNETIKKDLRFHLAEFSQGYPWLLKTLCSRVVAWRQAGVPQSDIAGRLLNVEALFQEDLRGLSSQTSATLRRIARAAPVRIPEWSENYERQAVRSLIRRGLLINIGPAYDVCGNVFRDFLSDGKVPGQDNYILLAKTGHVLWATRILQKSNGLLGISEFRAQAALSEKSFFHVIRDMNRLGLAKVDNGRIVLQIDFPKTSKDFEVAWRQHLRNRLGRNRLARKLLNALGGKTSLAMDEVSEMLERACPFMSASGQAWLTYARIFAKWMDAADLALLDRKNRTLNRYDPETEIRERHLLLPKRFGTKTPQIQYSPVEVVAARLVLALKTDGRVDWSGLKKSTIFRALATLEDLGFIQRQTRVIKVLPKGFEFVSNPGHRPRLFAEGALQMESFAAFLEILNSHKDKGQTLTALGLELCETLGAGWKESTAEKIAKIMLDWARHSQLAPGVFAQMRRGPIKGWKKKNDIQIPLF